MFRGFILLKPDPPDEDQPAFQPVSGLDLDPEVCSPLHYKTQLDSVLQSVIRVLPGIQTIDICIL